MSRNKKIIFISQLILISSLLFFNLALAQLIEIKGSGPTRPGLESQQPALERSVSQQLQDLKNAYDCKQITINLKKIYLCTDQESFQQFGGRIDKEAGQYNPSTGCIVIDTNYSNNVTKNGIKHECFHAFYNTYTTTKHIEISHLINEGMAVLQEDLPLIKKYIFSHSYNLHRNPNITKADRQSLYSLATNKTYSLDPRNSLDFYGQGTSLALFLCWEYKSCKEGLDYFSGLVVDFNKSDSAKQKMADAQKRWYQWENQVVNEKGGLERTIRIVKIMEKIHAQLNNR